MLFSWQNRFVLQGELRAASRKFVLRKMNKSLSTAFSVLVILVSLVLVDFPYLVGADSADYIHFIDSGVTVYSPVNMTYYYGDLVLNVSLYSAGIMGGLDPNISMNFSIDGKYNGSIHLRSNEEMHIMSKAVGTAALPQLLNGSHCLTIYTYGLNQRAYEPRYLSFVDTVYFSTTGNPASTPTINPTLTATPSPTTSNKLRKSCR